MSEQYDLTHLHVQRKLRPKIEDAIPFLVGKVEQQNTLDFIAWLRDNKASIGWGGVHNTWDAKIKGKLICRFKFGQTEFQNKDQWNCLLSLDNIGKYEDVVLLENLQNFLWDNVIFCIYATKIERPASAPKIKYFSPWWPCNTHGCAPGTTVTICGKNFENHCSRGNHRFAWFIEPKGVELAAVKRFIGLEMQARLGVDEQVKDFKDKLKTTVKELTTNVKFQEKFTAFDPAKCKPADKTPTFSAQHPSHPEQQFIGVPQVLEVHECDGAKCLYIETAENPRNKRRGFLIAENMKLEGELAVEVKVKPINGMDNAFELWLLGDTDDNLCFALNASPNKKFSVNTVRNNEYAYAIEGSKSILNVWHYLQIQLMKDKIDMLLLDANRVSVDKRTFDTPANFSRFDIALGHSIGPRTKKEYYFKVYVESVIVADCDCQDLDEQV